MTRQINRIAIDIGGTFTDLATVDGGTLELEKTPTISANLADGVLTAVEKNALDPTSLGQFVRGTTVVIDAIAERTGQETALLATTGFHDVLGITRADYLDMFNYQYEKPEPPVPRRHHWEIDGHIDQAESILTPLDEDGVREAAREIRTEGLNTIVACYVHGYESPEHEQRIHELIEEEYPEAYIMLSHELMKEYREYERTNTTVLNSYVRPIAGAYFDNLETQLDDRDPIGGKCAMKSNAGTASFARARRTPMEMMESGPAGNVYGAAYIDEQIGMPDTISFDMGGTTAKVSLVQDGNVTIDTDYWLESSPYDEGYPLKVSVVDIVGIGTGGGSAAWTDPGGPISVGPKNSGADPDPACYEHGGTKPIVTDTSLLTGRLNSDYFLDGEMDFNVGTTRNAVEPLAGKFDTAVEETARDVLRVVNSSTSSALKQVSIHRRRDSHDFAVVASGSAGLLYATTLGRELSVDETIIPRAPGQLSAWGMLVTDVRKDFARTHVTSFEVSVIEEVTAALTDLEEDAYVTYEPEVEVNRGDIELERIVDLRYADQEHTVNVPLTDDAVIPDAVYETIGRFHKRHDQAYDFRLDDDVEIVNFRLTAGVPMSRSKVTTVERSGCLEGAVKETQTVDFGAEGVHNTHVYERDVVPTTTPVIDPAAIEEPAYTTLIHPSQAFDVDELGDIHTQ